MSRKAVISTAVAPIHKEPEFISEMVTQGLMWESVTIVEDQDDWQRVQMDDGYEGWIHNFYLTKSVADITNSLTITNRYAPVSLQRGKDESVLAMLSFGTIVPVLEKTSGYSKIQLINSNAGFILPQENVTYRKRDIIIKLAKSLLTVPYLWGGKSSFGYDCSGFVQMVLKTAGISIARDTGEQIKTEGLEEISIHEVQRGDLIFFSENNRINHVAFSLGNSKIIHCSGEVKIESLIEGESGFSSTLSQLDHTAVSISKMVEI